MKFKFLMAASVAVLATSQGVSAQVAEPEPVEYVRVCDAFGEGYFFIPGTQTCMRIGGVLYTFAKGGREVAARSRDDLNPKTWRTETRAQLAFTTATDTELGVMRSHFELRSQFNDGEDDTSGSLRFGYIELAGLRVGLDESAINTFFDYYGDFISDDVVLGGAYRTNVIQYRFDASNGFSALLSVEQGSDDDTDFNGKIEDYAPHVVIGAKYEQKWGSITGAGAYDAVNHRWIGKAKISLNVTEQWNIWGMAAYKDLGDTYYEDDDFAARVTGKTRGIRAIDSFYGTWGGRWAGWLGTSYKFTEKTTGNLQLAYEGAGNVYSTANLSYEMVPGFTLMPEVSYRKWNDSHSDLKGKDAFQGAFRLQREF